jgi:hypothetical protein
MKFLRHDPPAISAQLEPQLKIIPYLKIAIQSFNTGMVGIAMPKPAVGSLAPYNSLKMLFSGHKNTPYSHDIQV